MGHLGFGVAAVDHRLALHRGEAHRARERVRDTGRSHSKVYLIPRNNISFNQTCLKDHKKIIIFQFISGNTVMSIVTIMIAFFVPVSVMIGLYVRVWWETVKRQRELVNLQVNSRLICRIFHEYQRHIYHCGK